MAQPETRLRCYVPAVLFGGTPVRYEPQALEGRRKLPRWNTSLSDTAEYPLHEVCTECDATLIHFPRQRQTDRPSLTFPLVPLERSASRRSRLTGGISDASWFSIRKDRPWPSAASEREKSSRAQPGSAHPNIDNSSSFLVARYPQTGPDHSKGWNKARWLVLTTLGRRPCPHHVSKTKCGPKRGPQHLRHCKLGTTYAVVYTGALGS